MRVQFGIAHCAPQVLMTNFYHVTITILTNKEILSKQHWNGVKYVTDLKSFCALREYLWILLVMND